MQIVGYLSYSESKYWANSKVVKLLSAVKLKIKVSVPKFDRAFFALLGDLPQMLDSAAPSQLDVIGSAKLKGKGKTTGSADNLASFG
jgi:hypothetical protein